jgi:hypothetical protein
MKYEEFYTLCFKLLLASPQLFGQLQSEIGLAQQVLSFRVYDFFIGAAVDIIMDKKDSGVESLLMSRGAGVTHRGFGRD